MSAKPASHYSFFQSWNYGNCEGNCLREVNEKIDLVWYIYVVTFLGDMIFVTKKPTKK